MVPTTIPKLLTEAAEKHGHKVAFIMGEKELSFREVKQYSERVAKHFKSIGLRKGDVIAVQLPNTIEFVIAHLAAAQMGLIFNPLSPNYREQELLYMLKHCDTKALIVSGKQSKFDYEEQAYNIQKKLSHLSHIIVVGERHEKESISFMKLLEDDVGFDDLTLSTVVPDDPMLIMFTSGTESNPKAVLHTYRTFVATHLQNGYEYGITDQDHMFCLTPLCHMFSLPMIMIGLHQGARHYIREDYSVEFIINDLISEQISFLVAAPAHLMDILHAVNHREAEKMNLRLTLTGGTKIPSQLVKNIREVLKSTVSAQWGMTEVCAGTFTRPADAPRKTWESVGRACPSGKVAIVDDETEEILPVGESGEIVFKGDSLFVEYYRNEELTKNTMIANGYFRTGDRGFLDKDGYLYFIGRTKDIINRGGLKYHTSEIEEALLMHSKVNQVAIVSVPDSRLGERACAYISLRNNNQLSFEEMQSFLRDKGFATYKLPEYLEVLDELPTTSTGKINKVPLREKAKSLGRK